MRLGLVVNPVAGGTKGYEAGKQVAALLADSNHQVLDLSGSNLAEAKNNLAGAISLSLIDLVILVGGDGMAHLGVNVCAESKVPMALVPAGTGNDAATLFGMPLDDPAACVELILHNLEKPKQIDAIRIDHDGVSSFALGSASAGFDALVNARANKMRWPKGPNRYYLAMLLELASFRPIQYRTVIDGVGKNFEAMLCVVSNTGVFGGGMLVVPDASATDGTLDILLVKKMSRLKLVAIFPKVYKGTHVTDPDVEILRAREVSIAANNMPIYSDGEYVGRAPFQASVLPAAVQVIAPAL
jgi:diacylglycerol kinase (ATP)